MHAVKMSALDGGRDESGRDLRETIKISNKSVAELELERNTSGDNVLCRKVKSCCTCTYRQQRNKLLETTEKNLKVENSAKEIWKEAQSLRLTCDEYCQSENDRSKVGEIKNDGITH